MLYYLFEYLNQNYDFPGLRLFQYITFRTSLAIIISLLITTVFGRRIINYLQMMQVGEPVRNLGLEGQMQKQGTPTMGGIMILLGILIPTLLLANLTNIYV
ncbi:MAG: phospho-N-acetylmuramoyl-pentapeptide-transferase, partial [Pedobacter sp.]